MLGFLLFPLKFLLGLIGFTSIGPAAGSLAAFWQSCIGLVSAGSFFAFLQSFAML